MPLPEGVRTHNQAYLDGWENGRCAMIEEFEAVALHWEREVGGGQERMREGARWLRTAINKVRQGENYDGCEHQGPDPWERLAAAERRLGVAYKAMKENRLADALETLKEACDE